VYDPLKEEGIYRRELEADNKGAY